MGKFIDRIGHIFGKGCVVLEFAGRDKRGKTQWGCMCGVCGKTFIVVSGSIVTGNTTQCKKCGKKAMGIKFRKPIRANTKFGLWKVLRTSKKLTRKWGLQSECVCLGCGHEQTVPNNLLRRRKTAGCLKCGFKKTAEKLKKPIPPGTCFGDIEVLGESKNRTASGKLQSICVCHGCKNKERFEVPNFQLLCGDTTSCGCYRRKLTSELAQTQERKLNSRIAKQENKANKRLDLLDDTPVSELLSDPIPTLDLRDPTAEVPAIETPPSTQEFPAEIS